MNLNNVDNVRTVKQYMDEEQDDEKFIPIVSADDFFAAINELVPSVSMQELEYNATIK